MERWGIRFGKYVPKVKPKDVCRSWKVFTGDQVHIIAGKYKGKEGKVIDVRRKQNLVVVEGLNIARRHFPTTPLGPGSIYNIEQGIHVSNVALIDPIQKKPAKVGWRQVTALDGRVIFERFSKLTSAPIDLPKLSIKKKPSIGPFDTVPSEVQQRTFVPTLTQDPIPKDCML